MTRWFLARSEVSSPTYQEVMELFSYQEYLGVSSQTLLVPEDEVGASYFVLQAAERTGPLLSSFEVWKSSILSS